MAYTAVPTKSVGETWTADEHNQYVRDNFAAGVPDIFTTKGDIAVATGDNAAVRMGVASTAGYVLTVDTSYSTTNIRWKVDAVKDVVTTKGDILVGTAADTLSRMGVGSDNQVLAADSATTTGLKWADSPVLTIDAKGDLLVGTAADTLGRLPVGTTSQILAVNSATTTGLNWIDSPAKTIDAKGDLLVGTAADTLGRLAVGANNTVLTADSSISTSGLKWGAAPAAAYARFKTNARQDVASASMTIINFHDEEFDTASAVTTGALWRFTCNSTNAGYYLVCAKIRFNSTSMWGVNEAATLNLYKNSASYTRMGALFMHAAGTYAVSVQGAALVSMAASDYIDLRAYQNSGGTVPIQSTGLYSWVSIARIF